MAILKIIRKELFNKSRKEVQYIPNIIFESHAKNPFCIASVYFPSPKIKQNKIWYEWNEIGKKRDGQTVQMTSL